MKRKQPFNEDHPDYERVIKEAIEGKVVDEDDEVVAMMQLSCPAEFLLFVLHDEIRGLKHQMYGSVASVALAIVWILWPIVVFLIGYTAPWAFVPFILALSAISGITAGYQIAATRDRWRRYQGFIRPAHEAMHAFLNQEKP